MNKVIEPGSLRTILARQRRALAKQIRTRYRPLIEAAGTREARSKFRLTMRSEIEEQVAALKLDPKHTLHCV